MHALWREQQSYTVLFILCENDTDDTALAFNGHGRRRLVRGFCFAVRRGRHRAESRMAASLGTPANGA